MTTGEMDAVRREEAEAASADDSRQPHPHNLLPWFARRVGAAPAPDRGVAPAIPLRPHVPERRRRLNRWIVLNLPGILGMGFESVFIVLALLLVPFQGNLLALMIVVVVFTVAPQRRRQHLTLSLLDDLPSMGLMVVTATLVGVLLLASSSSLVSTAWIAVAVMIAAVIGRGCAYTVTRRLHRYERYQRRTVIIGSGVVANRLVETMREYPEHGLKPHALLDDSPMPAAVASNIPVEPLANELRTYIGLHQIDTIVIAFSAMRESALLSLLRECDRMDCEVFVVPRLFEYVAVTGDMDRIHAMPLVRIRRDVHRSLAWRVKRVFSSVLAGLALLLLLPLLATIAAAVYVSDRSAPILFRQIRVSGDGKVFHCLKFRSMKPASTEEADTTWNISQDDRIGKLGRFLRKSSLDELPQLWNVLVGDMDLVGPRPERPHFVDKFTTEIPGYSARHRVPGGLTGWAAVHGLRGDTSLRDRALYDNYYIENWSLWLDVKILLRTVLAVLRRTGG